MTPRPYQSIAPVAPPEQPELRRPPSAIGLAPRRVARRRGARRMQRVACNVSSLGDVLALGHDVFGRMWSVEHRELLHRLSVLLLHFHQRDLFEHEGKI